MPNGPQKIILIRAGRYDYAEVELSGSIQIVGPNNTGKTTLINTLQFLYVDDLRTMNFGPYTLEQTLAYYFPAQYSYVLFECLGAIGKCVVGWRGQSKASGGEPERFTFVGPYEQDDFFDPKRQIREPREVAARLALKDFRLVKSAQEHRELLLPPAGSDAKGLGLVALRDADRFRRFRESLKDLLNLSAISQEQMRERLLTLADVRTDLPALDVRRLFGDDYDKIRQRRDALARFKRNEEQIRLLVQKSSELNRVRGELVFRWSDLREKRIAFEQAHESAIGSLRASVAQDRQSLQNVAETLKDRTEDLHARISERATVETHLGDIAKRAETLKDFNPDLSELARQNLKREEQRLARLLADAETESREKAQQKLTLYGELVRQKQDSIANFDRLAITALRKHFSDEELDRAFRVLDFGLLETVVGPDGIQVRNESGLFQAIRELSSRVREGKYQDGNIQISFRPAQREAKDLSNVERLREELQEHSATFSRWQSILKSINDREKLAAELRQSRAGLAALERQIFAYEELVKARAEEPRLRRDLDALDEAVAKLKKEIARLDQERKEIEVRQRKAENAILAQENEFSAIMSRFTGCLFPEFSAKETGVSDIPPDFESAIARFLHEQQAEQRLSEDVEQLLKIMAQVIGEEFSGADDSETIQNLAGELEALPEKTEALEREWNALIHGLRGTFDNVLRELDAVRAAATDLNRQFGKITVSNLKSIKLEVLEAGDIVSWIRRLVNLEQPGLFDDDTQLDQTLRNFRQKLEGSPLIGFSQLFSLGISTEGEDGVRHHYQDLKQIESHGTTIAIKVLFNLLVLRRYLREEQCVVPFFLDEVQALDPANRHAILTTARKLGFLAITAAPEAITEVDALYFLQPQQGRIVLRQRHRLGIKMTGPA